MHNYMVRFSTGMALISMLGAFILPGTAAAQGKIVCWKDSAGKTIGCGDKVPPEYQGSATKELSRQGITRQTVESVEDANQRRAREQATLRAKAEDDKRAVDQKRQDAALLETYANEKEIDSKRDRDLGVLDSQLEQLTTGLKGATARHTDTKGRHDQAEKTKAGNLAAIKDELNRVAADRDRLQKAIEAKQKEKEDTRKRYAEYRKRYTELKSGQVLSGQAPTPAATTPSTVAATPAGGAVSKPVAAPVPAKK
jgi:hypothetical protein